jgi:pimeloyl-ACP methyl ester carboxylesterase
MAPAMVVLVHGTCGTPAAWSRVIPLLDRLGVPNVAVQLPSCLPESEMDDATSLRSVLDECVDPVVLVGHSGGGMVLTELGTHPSVKRLVYMDALMLDAGETQADILTEENLAAGFLACVQADDAGLAFDTDALAGYLVGRGYSSVDARECVSGLRPQRAAASIFENSVVAWRSVPSTFISCDDSEISSDLRAVFASRATDVIEMPGDHFPNWSRPGEVAEILARIARDVGDQ